ncbi:MAG: hypothetical protein ACOYBE_12580 [Blautia sp.]|jgi:hypothetical protein
MDENSYPMTPFDEMVGSDQVQMLKAALPYLPVQGQRFVSVYAKFMELKNTMSLFSGPMQSMAACDAQKSADPLSMLNDIRRFCHGKSKEQLDQLTEAMAMIQMLEVFQEP